MIYQGDYDASIRAAGGKYKLTDIDSTGATTNQVIKYNGTTVAWGDESVSPGEIALTSAHILVGNGSNVAADVALSGDATISNTGVVTVSGSSSLTFSVTGNMEIAGAVTVSGGTLAGLFYPVGVNPQALSGPGALNTTAYQTQWTSTGTGDALTLADVTHIGHVKKISYVAEAAGGDTGVITPASVVGFSTVTLNAIGDYVVLAWAGSGWAILEYYGATVA